MELPETLVEAACDEIKSAVFRAHREFRNALNAFTRHGQRRYLEIDT